MNNKIKFFGYLIDNLSMRETLLKLEEVIKNNERVQHVVINVAKLINSQKSYVLKESIESADIINIDGAGIIYGMKLLSYNPKERVAGIDLMQELIILAEKKSYSIYFLGAKQIVLNNMLENFKQKYPSLLIAGSRNGYWDTEDEEKAIVKEISDLKPNIIFVGISSPKKEIFIAKNKDQINCNIIMGVGGSFDVFSGITKRAPVIMQKYGLEWLFRIYQEPNRMWKRYLITNYIYIVQLVKLIFAKQNNKVFNKK